MPLHLPFGQLFTAKRNRVEFVCDFPEGDDAEVISSLQLHPQGWVAVTRNLAADEESEVGALAIAFEFYCMCGGFTISVRSCLNKLQTCI